MIYGKDQQDTHQQKEKMQQYNSTDDIKTHELKTMRSEYFTHFHSQRELRIPKMAARKNFQNVIYQSTRRFTFISNLEKEE